jgi:hypothetical protein
MDGGLGRYFLTIDAIFALAFPEAERDGSLLSAAEMQQARDTVAHLLELRRVDRELYLQTLTQVLATEDANQALDAFILARVLEASTLPDEDDLAGSRAERDAALAQLGPWLDEQVRAGIADRLAHDAGTQQAEDDTWNDLLEDVHADLEEDRDDLTGARTMTDEHLTALRRYLYDHLPLPWIAYAAPCHITAVDKDAKLCTVALEDGSGGNVDGVEYGSGTPTVGAPTTLYVPARRPADPADPAVRPVPGGRCWVTLPPPGGKFAYYEYAFQLWKVPWPLTDPDVEPEAVRSLNATVSFGMEHGWHPEDNLGFDGLGRWWAFVSWTQLDGAYQTIHYWLVGWDVLAGEANGMDDPAHEYFYGTRNDATTVQIHPVVWATDATPGHTGFIGFWGSSGPGAGSLFGVPGTYGQIAFADEAGGEWTYGQKFLMDDRYNVPGHVPGGHEYRSQIFEHNAHWLWHEGAQRRARWGLMPRAGLGETFTRFYNEASQDVELSNAGFESIVWAAPGATPATATMFVRDPSGGLTRRTAAGFTTALALPPGLGFAYPGTRFPVGHDRTLSDLLLQDSSGHQWASEDSGDSWYQTAFTIPNRANFEGGKWVYIIDEAEYRG